MKYLLSVLLFISLAANAQVKPKVVTECTIDYKVEYGTADTTVQQIVMTLYIKGKQSRLDFITPSYSQIKYFNGNTNSAVILQDLGATKVRRDLDSLKWKQINEKYNGLSIAYSDETKMISGYECKKAIITLKDGSAFLMFYATGIVPSTKEYEYQFRNIPGFVLEYETVADGSNQKIKYTATKINLSPVQNSKFEIPKAGYRIL